MLRFISRIGVFGQFAHPSKLDSHRVEFQVSLFAHITIASRSSVSLQGVGTVAVVPTCPTNKAWTFKHYHSEQVEHIRSKDTIY